MKKDQKWRLLNSVWNLIRIITFSYIYYVGFFHSRSQNSLSLVSILILTSIPYHFKIINLTAYSNNWISRSISRSTISTGQGILPSCTTLCVLYKHSLNHPNSPTLGLLSCWESQRRRFCPREPYLLVSLQELAKRLRKKTKKRGGPSCHQSQSCEVALVSALQERIAFVFVSLSPYYRARK